MIRICYIYWELNAQSDSACLAQARQNRSGKEIGLNRLFYVRPDRFSRSSLDNRFGPLNYY